MTRNAADLLRRASESSTVVDRIRPAIAGSVVCASASAVLRSLAGARHRIVVGLHSSGSASRTGPASHRLEGMVGDSRVVRAFWSLFTVPAALPRESGVARLLDPIVALDLPGRVRAAACTILAAVATHTLLMAALGVHVHALGWTIRAALVAGCAIVLRFPASFAAAWSDRRTIRGVRHP
jgi:hypothetical protein